MESPPYPGVNRAVATFWTDNGAEARLCSLLRPSRAHCSLLCDALHRESPDPERLGHLQDTHTLRKLLSHPAFGRAVDLRSAELHALRYRALETCFDPRECKPAGAGGGPRLASSRR